MPTESNSSTGYPVFKGLGRKPTFLGVPTRWHLRLGNQVLSIHNEDYGRTELPAHTGTVSPDVVRVLSGTNPPSANAHKVAP